jgi:hypothetical protein
VAGPPEPTAGNGGDGNSVARPACGVTLSSGFVGRGSGTVTGSEVAGGSGATPPRAGDGDDPGDGQDNHAIEPACTSGSTGSSRGGGFATHGGGGRGQGGGRFGRDHSDD